MNLIFLTTDNRQQTTDHIYGRKVKYLTGDRGYRGQQTSGDTKILIPDVPKASDSAYTKAKKHKLFRKRASIEPVIGHCKSDHRLGRNFYKGLFGDSINVILAAAAFNLGAYCFFDNKPKALQGFTVENTGQLALF